MKKFVMSPWIYGLALTLVMYNCKKKDEPFPTEPDTELVKEINAIQADPVTLVQPAAVTSTPSSLAASAKATAVAGDLGSLSSGTVPASVQTASTDIKAALSATELNALSSLTPATINAVAAGGALPADLKAIMDKAMANPALKAYLPTMTLPTVNGKSVSGRTGAPESVEKTDGIEVEDACVLAAQAAFDAVKTKLDAAKATKDAEVAAAYSAAIAPLAAEQASCTSGVPATYAAMRTAAQAQATKALADLEGAKSKIPADLYATLQSFINIQLLSFLSSANALQAADLKACSETLTAKTAAAAAARDANSAAVNASYTAAIAKATAKKTELVQSCHNQGGGK
jgi:hypothetical protein